MWLEDHSVTLYDCSRTTWGLHSAFHLDGISLSRQQGIKADSMPLLTDPENRFGGAFVIRTIQSQISRDTGMDDVVVLVPVNCWFWWWCHDIAFKDSSTFQWFRVWNFYDSTGTVNKLQWWTLEEFRTWFWLRCLFLLPNYAIIKLTALTNTAENTIICSSIWFIIAPEKP